jgi:hypothetical protein
MVPAGGRAEGFHHPGAQVEEAREMCRTSLAPEVTVVPSVPTRGVHRG